MAVGVVDTQIRFKFGARTLTLHYRKVPVKKWRELKALHDLTQTTLIQALYNADIDAIYSIIWLERCQRERELAFVQVSEELEQSNEDFAMIDIRVKGQVVLSSTEHDAPREIDGDAADPTESS